MIREFGPATFVVTFGILVLAFMQSADSQALLRFPYHRDVTYVRKFNCAPNGSYDTDYTQYSNSSRWKCGVCGDVLADPKPRSNEYGGILYKQYPGVKAAYIEGALATVQFSMGSTSTALGYVDMRICKDATLESDNQECFDENLLHIEGVDTPDYSVEDTRVNIKSSYKNYNATVSVKLPEGLTCTNCVMQLHHRTGLDTKGYCSNNEETNDGHCKLQNTFFDCSDIRILPKTTEIELMPNAVYTNICIKQPELSTAGSLVALGTCSAGDQTQRIFGLPKWEGNGGKNPFVIVFPYTSLCLQFNSYTDTNTYGNITVEECTFAANQNFMTGNKTSNSFQLKSRYNANCLRPGGQSIHGFTHVTQEECDKTKPEQFWTHSVNLTTQAVI